MRKISITALAKTTIAAVFAGALIVSGSAPASAQISAGIGIGPVGVGVNLGARGYYDRDGYWHDYRDRVVVHDYDRPYAYETAYPYGYYYRRYDCGNPYSPYYDTDFCD